MSRRKEAYERYLLSNTWKAKRQERLSIDKNCCQGCGSTEKLHVHHRTYLRFGGKEQVDDLVTVCETCHSIIHKLHKSGRISLEKATLAVAKKIQVPEKVKTKRLAISHKKKKKRLAVATSAFTPRRKSSTSKGWTRDSDFTWVPKNRPRISAEEKQRRLNGLT